VKKKSQVVQGTMDLEEFLKKGLSITPLRFEQRERANSKSRKNVALVCFAVTLGG
jgi:hypothetical protein